MSKNAANDPYEKYGSLIPVEDGDTRTDSETRSDDRAARFDGPIGFYMEEDDMPADFTAEQRALLSKAAAMELLGIKPADSP